jgi:hypothetical protein
MWPFGARRKGLVTDKARWRLRVYMPRAASPGLLSIANKAGSNGAVKGYIVPLDKSPNDVDLMHARLGPGRYGIVAASKKTAVNVSVAAVADLPNGAEEAAESARRESDALRSALERILRQDPFVTELTFAEIGPNTLQGCEFLQLAADRVAVVGEGLLRDVILQRWWAAGQWSELRRTRPENVAAAFVAVFAITREGSRETWVHTLGMHRFGLPEFETFLETPAMAPVAGEYLLQVGTYLFGGRRIAEGEIVGDGAARLAVRRGTRKQAHWGEALVFELVGLEAQGRPLNYADQVFRNMTLG